MWQQSYLSTVSVKSLLTIYTYANLCVLETSHDFVISKVIILGTYGKSVVTTFYDDRDENFNICQSHCEKAIDEI